MRAQEFTENQIATWPECDRSLFEMTALVKPISGKRRRRLENSTVQQYVDGYTQCLRWLMIRSEDLLQKDPIDRWTPSFVWEMAEAWKAQHNPYSDNTIRIRLIGLWRIIQLMYPHRDARFILGPLRRLSRASQRDMSSLPDLDQLKEFGRSMMNEALVLEVSRSTAIAFRTGLQIAWLAEFGFRLANLASIEEGRDNHFWQDDRGIGWVQFLAHEVKNDRVIRKNVPSDLIEWVEHFRPYREYLCRGSYGASPGYSGGSLWVSSRGQEQSAISIYKSIVKATRKGLGISVTPHSFRHAIATHMSVNMVQGEEQVAYKLAITPSVASERYRLNRPEDRRRRMLAAGAEVLKLVGE